MMLMIRRSTFVSVLVLSVYIAFEQASKMQLLTANNLQIESTSLLEKSPCMHPVTIVTAYYPLNSSKHSSREYNEWMANFFPYVSAPIVLYSPPGEALDQILKLRGDLPMTVKLQELWEIPIIKPHRMELKTRQHDLDPEHYAHSAELYGIWTAKSWMVEQTMAKDFFHSDYFFWVDAGSWRIKPLPNWPDSNKIKELYARNTVQGDEMILGSAILQQGTPYIQGTFFGGTKAAIHWWAAEYFRLFNEWLDSDRFAGKDQDLMTDIYNRNLHRTILLRSFEIDDQLWNPWFFFQPFLARSSSIASDIKQGLQLDSKRVWDSKFITPSTRAATREDGWH